MRFSRLLLPLLSASLLATAHFSAQADLLIGRTAGLSGPAGTTAKEIGEGARLWLDAINERGGINGQKVTLQELDDQFEPKLAADNARKLIEESNVLALLLSYGTPHTEAMLPVLEQHKVALVAPSSGAMVLHQPVKKYVFNVRSPYQSEAEKIIQHQLSVGVQRIAIVHADDSYGLDGLAGAQKAFEARKLTPVAVEKFDRASPDFAAIAKRLAPSNPQTVLIIAASRHTAECLKALQAAGITPQIATLSNNASAAFVRLMGDKAANTMVSVVFPSERAYVYPLVKEAVDLARAKKLELSPVMLEGYAGAKVLTEALRLAGKQPTRDKVQAALEGMRKYDLGGLEVSYSPTDHSGLNFIELAIIDRNGHFKR